MGEHVQIGQVAERTELSVRTVRHYDEVGLIVPSARSAGGFRLYTSDDIDRLLLVRRMKPLGFTLEEMRELLDAVAVLEADGDGDPADGVERARAVVAGYDERARERVVELRRTLAAAEELADRLAAHARPAATPPARP
ncbi:hypothetical protein GCM10027047_28190 [Rhodococcus aerolatus]